MARVVMVDDEADLVWSMARRMARERPNIRFDAFTDPLAALAALQAAPADLLITDVRMPGMNGIELVLRVRERQPDLQVVVITAYGTPDVRAEVERRSVSYLEKPFSFTEFVTAIEAGLKPRGGFSGAISVPMLPDLVQMYALCQARGALSIERGAEVGAIWFDGGDIVHAECGPLNGPDAFYRLLTWEGGTFSMSPGLLADRRTISESWQELLVEGCRLMDEVARPQSDAGEAPWEELRGAVARVLGELLPTAAVVGLSLPAGDAVAIYGTPAQLSNWPDPVRRLVSLAERACREGAAGTIEVVTRAFGASVSWDRGAGLAIVVGHEFAEQGGAARFRAAAARSREALAQWMTV